MKSQLAAVTRWDNLEVGWCSVKRAAWVKRNLKMASFLMVLIGKMSRDVGLELS